MRHYSLIVLCLTVLWACNTVPTDEGQNPSAPEWEVGTQVLSWTDSKRTDPYYGGPREMTVQLWYPIEPDPSLKRAPYVPELSQIQGQITHWSQEDLEWIDSIPAGAFKGGKLASSSRPFKVLVFSPSLGGHRSFYSYFAENLAKAGYVVMGVNHKYESDYVISADQSIIPYNHRYHDSLENLQIPEQITGDGFREKKSLRASVQAEDLLFCLEQLEQLNSSFFQEKLDFSRIGCWGHSIGGSTAMEASQMDPRIKVVVNMDGTPPTSALKGGIKAHFLFLEDLTDYKNHSGYRIQFDRRKDVCEKVKGHAYRILIDGAQHNSFTDIPYHAAENPEDREKAQKILMNSQRYLSEFFNHYLDGNQAPLDWKSEEGIEVFRFVD